MSKLRSPRLDCSMTIGTSCERISWWSITGGWFLALLRVLHRADRRKVQGLKRAAPVPKRKGRPGVPDRPPFFWRCLSCRARPLAPEVAEAAEAAVVPRSQPLPAAGAVAVAAHRLAALRGQDPS